MTGRDETIRALAADLRTAHADAEVAIDRFRLLQHGRRLRVPDIGLSWPEWLASPDGVAYAAVCARFEDLADQLIDARPASLLAYCEKLEALTLADLDEDDQDRLTAERRAIIAAGEGAP